MKLFLPKVIIAALTAGYVSDAVAQRTITATTQRHAEIPTLYITTATGADPTDKEVYINCNLRFVENGTPKDYTTTTEAPIGIRGRGNSTWGAQKKPWRIKFSKKQELLGSDYAKAKSWTLLANAFDKSLMRNALTWHLGKAVGLDFCPAYKFVDLYMNGTYKGVYQISDQVEVAEKRVFLKNKDTDWLLEYANSSEKVEEPKVNWTSNGYYDNGNLVKSSNTYGYVEIKNPEDDGDKLYLTGKLPNGLSAQENINRFFIDTLGVRLHPNTYSVDFQNPNTGYRALVDTASLINWYIATEITANWDGFYSVYMYKTPYSKLYFGPLWDEDLAYGNHTETYDRNYFPSGDFYDKLLCENNFNESVGVNSYRRLQPAIEHLWTDPWFANAVRMRYKQLLAEGLQNKLLAGIASMNEQLVNAGPDNFETWKGKDDDPYSPEEYRKSWPEASDKLKEFVKARLAKLETLIDNKTASIVYLSDKIPYSYDNQKVHLVIDRQLKKNMWNTVCFPFDVSPTKISRWMGSETIVAEFSGVTKGSDGTEIINFSSNTGDLTAGTPYLICPSKDVTEPWGFDHMTFDSSNTPHPVTHGDISFVGLYAPTTLTKGDRTVMFLGPENKLYTPGADISMGGYRAYFKLNGNSNNAKLLAIDGMTSAISTPVTTTKMDKQGVYNLNGQFVSPNDDNLPKGIYIINGKKTVVK
ncbi:MAG: CotH kinase family protein [Prevotella sp.]